MRRIVWGLSAALAGIPFASAPSAGQEASPRVEIFEPAQWSTGARGVAVVRRGSLRVIGSVEDPGRVSAIRLNDRPVAYQEFPNGSLRFSGAMDVTADTRRAILEVVRVDGSSFEYDYPIQPLLDERPEDPAARWDLASDGFRGQRWALVIGISEYQDPEIPDLRFAAQDAEAFAEFLRTPEAGLGGYRESNVLLLKNEEATFQNIRTALRSWLRQAQPEDIIQVFIAGHGLPDPFRPQELYLLPYDTRIENLAATAIPMEEFQRDLDRLESRATIVFADACHSAGVGAGVRAFGSNPINEVFLDRMSVGRGGLVTITSSQANELSREDAAYGDGHGVFTYHLLQGLRGAADRDGDGIVDLGELFDFVRTSVSRATLGSQTPAISDRPFERAWPMALVDGAADAWAWEQQETGSPDVSASVFLGVYDENQRWYAPDSLVAVVGHPEVVNVRLGGPAGDALPPSLLEWRSSHEDVVAVARTGELTPRSPGLATVSVGARNRRLEIPVRVYDTPTAIRWNPAAEEIAVMRGEPVRISLGLELPGGQVVQGLLPRIEVRDTLVLAREGPGVFRAASDGTTVVTASLGGETHSWSVAVRAPILRIQAPTGAVLVGDTLELRADYVREDGSYLGPASSISWDSTDREVVEVGLGGMIPKGVGRATVTAGSGPSSTEISVTVLGDLLLTTRDPDGVHHLLTLALQSGETYSLLHDGRPIRSPTLSPDGRTIAFVGQMDGGRPRIFLMDSDGSNIRRLNAESGSLFGLRHPFYQEHDPVWSHDGTKIHFTSNDQGRYQMYSVAPDGSGRTRIRGQRAGDRNVTAAPDAPRIAYERISRAGQSDVIVALEAGTEAINATGVRRPSSRRRVARPVLLPGGGGILAAETDLNWSGEALALFDIQTGQRIVQLVAPEAHHQVIFAASPKGDRIAYFQRSTGGGSGEPLMVMNLDGEILRSLRLPNDHEVEFITWGALPASRAEGGVR